MPTCVPGRSSVGVSKASVTSTVFAPLSGAGRVATLSRSGRRAAPFGNRAGGRADDKSRRVGDRQRRHHLHLLRIDEPQNRIALVGAHAVAGIVQPLGDRPVERRADSRVPALRLDRRRAPLSRRPVLPSAAVELAIGVVQLAARRRTLVDEHSDAPLRELGLLHAKIRRLHRRFVDGGLRAERRKLEPHEHLAALDRVADVLRDFGDARGLRGDDGERGARQCPDDSGRADRCADVSEPDRLGDDRNRRLGLGFAEGRRGRQAGRARRAASARDAGLRRTALRLYRAARAFGRCRLLAGDRRHDFGQAIEDPLVSFLLIEKVRAVAPDALFFLVGQVEAGQHHDRQIDEAVVETHQLEHFDTRSIVVEADVENHRVERRRRLLQRLKAVSGCEATRTS